MVNKKLVLCVLALSMLTAPVAQSIPQKLDNGLTMAQDWLLNEKRTWLKNGVEQHEKSHFAMQSVRPMAPSMKAAPAPRVEKHASFAPPSFPSMKASMSKGLPSPTDDVDVMDDEDDSTDDESGPAATSSPVKFPAVPSKPDADSKDTKKTGDVWTYKNDTQDLPSQKILQIPLVPSFMGKGFRSPLEFVLANVISSFAGKIICGKASLKEHGKFALCSASGALATSLVRLAQKHSEIALAKDRTKSIKAVKIASLFFQIAFYLAGQNPDQAQAIWKSLADGNAGKDSLDFISSLDDDARLLDRIAALTRNAGPIALNAWLVN